MEKINFVKLASHKSETTYLKILQRDWCLPPLVTHAPMITRLPLLQLSTWKHHECSALKSAAHTSAQSKVKVNIAQITQYTRRRRDQAKSAQAHSSQSTKHKAHGVVIGSGCTFVWISALSLSSRFLPDRLTNLEDTSNIWHSNLLYMSSYHSIWSPVNYFDVLLYGAFLGAQHCESISRHILDISFILKPFGFLSLVYSHYH